MSWCRDGGRTEMADATKYGILSIRSLSRNGKIHPKHCKTALPKTNWAKKQTKLIFTNLSESLLYLSIFYHSVQIECLVQHLTALREHCTDFHTQDLDKLTFVCGLGMDLLSFDAVNLEHLSKQLRKFSKKYLIQFFLPVKF